MESSIQFKFKDKVFIVLAIAGLILAFYFHFFDIKKESNNEDWQNFSGMYKELSDENRISLKINDIVFQLDVAKSENKKHQGLSGKEFLLDNQGMLFIFPQKGEYSFVMKNMNIDLDFIFIKNGKVVEIIKKVPFDFKGKLKGKNNYDSVLEMNAGWADQNEVRVGDEILINKRIN